LEYIIRIDMKESGWEGVDRIHGSRAQGPMAGCCEHGNKPSVSVKGGEFLD